MVFSNNQWFTAPSSDDVVSVGNSALYNTANTEYLSRTPSGAGTSATTWTMSFWVYRTRFGGSTGSSLFGCTPATNTTIQVYFSTSDTLKLHYILSTTDKVVLETTQKFRDIGWYHICVVADTSNIIANNRVRFIVNGERVTSFSTETQNSGSGNNIAWNSASTNHVIGAILNTSSVLSWPADSYFAEVVFLDGTASSNGSEFAAYDSSGLYWTPKSSDAIKALTFGTNGFYLDNTTNAQTDASGEGNNWTNNNTVTTNPNSPTNSYPVQNPLTITNSYPSTLAEGNLKQTGNSGGSFASGILATIPCDGGGKYYWEAKCLGLYTTNAYINLGVAPMDLPRVDNVDGNGNFCLPGQQDYQGVSITFNGTSYTNLRGNSLAVNSNIVSALTIATNDFMQIAFDSATQKVWFGKNNSWYNSGDPAGGSNETITLTATDKTWFPWFGTYTASDIWRINYGATDFNYTPPTGFNKVNTTQIASDTTRTASDSSKYFQTVLYEGNGEQQRVGNFQPFTDSYTIAKSALFNSASSENFSKSWGTPTNNKIFTFSTWFKLCDQGDDVVLFSSNNTSMIDIDSSNNIRFWQYSSSAFQFHLVTDLEYTDNSQWANLVVMMDTTQSTAANRTKMYLNGVQITSFSTESYIAQDATPHMNNSSYTHYIGQSGGSSNYWEGYLAETAFLDGQTLTASSFGSTDTSSGTMGS
jgi:hypothetical protein